MNTSTHLSSPPPSPAVLAAYECWQLLETEEVARVAWAGPDGVAIVPISYTVADGALWFRTEPYTALARQCTGGRVAVEADHLDRTTHEAWSVVVTGTAERVAAEEVPGTVGEMPAWAPGRRNLYVRVTPGEVTGRRLTGRPRPI